MNDLFLGEWRGGGTVEVGVGGGCRRVGVGGGWGSLAA